MMSRVDQGSPPTEEDEVDQATGTVLASAGDGAARRPHPRRAPSLLPQHQVRVRARWRCATAPACRDWRAKRPTSISVLGYTTDAGNASSSDYQNTVVVYNDSSQSDAAKEIAQTIGVSLTIQNDGVYSFDTDFLVVIGADWA